MPHFALANLQGNVLRAYSHPFAAFLFLHIDESEPARQWLKEILGKVTTAEPWERKPESTLNVLFAHAGLHALGASSEVLDSFPSEFQAGMAARASLLGDTGASAPETWEEAFGNRAVHAMVSIYGLTPDDVGVRESWLSGLLDGNGVRIVARQTANRLSGGVEHFGFADGMGQPSLEARGLPSMPGDGSPEEAGGWRDIEAGEFVLGHHDEEHILPAAPKPHALGSDSTYVVYRKLRQDVAAFRTFVDRHADDFAGGPEALAAKIVGRWRDGTPLAVSPQHADANLASDERRNNDFRYSDDVHGYRCPLGSHVRRANPRDALPFGAKLVKRHRMLRRGIPYGNALPAMAADDGQDRGLLFICLQADIGRQFEFVQSQWLNDGNIFRLGDDSDPLVSKGGGKMTIQGQPPRFLYPLPQVVTTRGGEYFFLPSLTGLGFLSNLS